MGGHEKFLADKAAHHLTTGKPLALIADDINTDGSPAVTETLHKHVSPVSTPVPISTNKDFIHTCYNPY